MQSELLGVAQQYAQALLDLALEQADEIASDLEAVNNVIKMAPDLNLVLGHPSVSAESKKNLLMALFGSQANELTMRFLALLSDKRRLDILPSIERKYRQLLDSRKNIVALDLMSSKPLSEKAIANIKARLTEHIGKKLALTVTVDKSLLAGLKLRLGDQVIDGSVKGKLQAIEKMLLSV